MEKSLKIVIVIVIVLLSVSFEVSGYCAPGTDTTLDVIKPLNGKKVKVAAGKETILEVRYKGNPEVRWYIRGKQIPRSSKSRHFEFIKGGPGLDQIGPILKIKNFKKKLAGLYKVTINNAGCVNRKTIQVEYDKTFNIKEHIDTVLKKVPYLKTKAGVVLVIVLFGFLFIIIPIMVCSAMCNKIRKLKKELGSERGKMEMFYEYEAAKRKKRKRRATIDESSLEEDLKTKPSKKK